MTSRRSKATGNSASGHCLYSLAPSALHITIMVPQVIAFGLLLFAWNCPGHAAVLLLLIAVQQVLMPTFLREPVMKALWYSGFGVPFSVLGMMVCAHALRSLGGAA